MNFNDYVNDTIKEMVNEGTPFSAFSVTERVREKLNSGGYLSDRTKQTVWDAKSASFIDAYEVPHYQVKRLVRDYVDPLINNGSLTVTTGLWMTYVPSTVSKNTDAKNTATLVGPDNGTKVDTQAGSHTVKGYMRNGSWVNGYTRKNPTR